MSNAIRVSNLTKWYQEHFSLLRLITPPWKPCRERALALSKVSFQINQGETVALLGPNGAGKSTLLKILATLVIPDEGNASIQGLDIEKEPERVKKSIGLVLGEERSFYWRLTARDNLEFFATLCGFTKKETAKKVLKVSKLFNIDYLDKRYQELSTGMKNRLALARSSLTEPQIMLMDEPTRSLDPNAAKDLRELIQNEYQTNPERTLFFSTHNLREAEELADRVIILNQGRIVAEGTQKDLAESTNCFGGLEAIYHSLISCNESVEATL